MLPILVRGQSVYQTVSTSPSRAFFATSVSSFNLNRSQFVRNLFETGSQRKDDRYGNLLVAPCKESEETLLSCNACLERIDMDR